MIFEQHMDGTIFLRKEDGTFYRDTAANFEADSGFTLPPLPEGWQGRTYHQGSHRHVLQPGTMEPDPDGQSWPDMDAVLSDFDNIIGAQDARLNPPPTLAELKALRIGQVKGAGFDRVHEQYPPHAQRRLAFAPDTDAERTACRDLILAVKAKVDLVEAEILAATSKVTVETAAAALALPE